MVLARLLRTGESRTSRRLVAIADAVSALSEKYAAYTDAELAACTQDFRGQLAAGSTLDDLLVEAFAVVCEAADRVLGMRPYTVQVMGGAALHLGSIAQMGTGEGKTLVAALPSYLGALAGRGVHVVTVNDYLATRDAAQIGRVHAALGLTVAAVVGGLTPTQRQAAYAADITYGTAHEFGFDYLRDHMATAATEVVQREHFYAIVDEVDSVLLDEARTPLIISGPAVSGPTDEAEFAALARQLTEDEHYTVDRKLRTIALTDAGVTAAEAALGRGNLYTPERAADVLKLHNAVTVHALHVRDRDYVVADDAIVIVDENTGRPQPDRRFSYGLHQALEAKEGLPVRAENQTMGSVTLQNFFRLYDRLAGMTGTADTEAAEFAEVYQLAVIPIPTNRPRLRIDHPDVIYPDAQAKLAAVVADVAARTATGQPVLIGTGSVEASETVSAALSRAGIDHTVLNAKHHAAEAHLIAQAGRPGAVTVSTQMAGRGTDILLGGNADELAAAQLAGLTETHLAALADDLTSDQAAGGELSADQLAGLRLQAAAHIEAEHGQRVRAHAAAQCAADRDAVLAAGGLYVLGTERTDSRRVDNQLRGRAGRQGDPGETRIYTSLEDPLLARMGAAAVAPLLRRSDGTGAPLSSRLVTTAVNRAQASVEARSFDARKELLRYDEILNAQRKVIYRERDRLLAGEDMSAQVQDMLAESMRTAIDAALDDDVDSWDLQALHHELGKVYPVGVTVDQLAEHTHLDRASAARAALTAQLVTDLRTAYAHHVATRIGQAWQAAVERMVLMLVLDLHWRAHLAEMDYLKDSISLRAFAQKDPLVEYRREATELFTGLRGAVRAETVQRLFTASISTDSSSTDGAAPAPTEGDPTAPPADGIADQDEPAAAGEATDGAAPQR